MWEGSCMVGSCYPTSLPRDLGLEMLTSRPNSWATPVYGPEIKDEEWYTENARMHNSVEEVKKTLPLMTGAAKRIFLLIQLSILCEIVNSNIVDADRSWNPVFNYFF